MRELDDFVNLFDRNMHQQLELRYSLLWVIPFSILQISYKRYVKNFQGCGSEEFECSHNTLSIKTHLQKSEEINLGLKFFYFYFWGLYFSVFFLTDNMDILTTCPMTVWKEWRKAAGDLSIVSEAGWTTFMGFLPTFNHTSFPSPYWGF